MAEKLTRERRRQQTREALIEAAAEVFVERGFNAASLDHIAETAGFTRGAIYKHFDGKTDLFLAVIERSNEQAMAAFAKRFEANPASAFDPHALAATWKEAIASNNELDTLDLEFRLLAQRKPEMRRAVAKFRRRNRKTYAEFAEQTARELGVRLTLPPDVVAGIMTAVTDGFTMAAKAGDKDAVELYEKFLELFQPILITRRGKSR